MPTSSTGAAADAAAPGLRIREDIRTTFEYFRGALGVTLLGLVAAFMLGLVLGGHFDDGISLLVVCLALTVLEISLSFDNAGLASHAGYKAASALSFASLTAMPALEPPIETIISVA